MGAPQRSRKAARPARSAGSDDVVGGRDQHRVVVGAQQAEPGRVDQAAAGAEQVRLVHHLDPGPAGEVGDQPVRRRDGR